MLSNFGSQRELTVAGLLLAMALVLMAVPHSSEAADAPAQEQSAAYKPAAPAVEQIPQIEKAVVGMNYIILPITTNLQRARGKAYEKASFFVLINGQALFNEDDTVLNMSPLGLQALRETMQGYSHAGVGGDSVIRISWPLPLPRPKDYGGERASLALQCLLKHSYITAGWPGAVHVEIFWTNRDWKYANAWESLVADLTKPPPEGAVEDEAGVGDDQVKLYAVSTPFSQFLFGGYSVPTDCVVHIIPPIEEAKASAVLTMQRCLSQLRLERKNTVFFLESWKDSAASNAVHEDFSGEHVWKDLLGFKTSVHSARN